MPYAQLKLHELESHHVPNWHVCVHGALQGAGEEEEETKKVVEEEEDDSQTHGHACVCVCVYQLSMHVLLTVRHSARQAPHIFRPTKKSMYCYSSLSSQS